MPAAASLFDFEQLAHLLAESDEQIVHAGGVLVVKPLGEAAFELRPPDGHRVEELVLFGPRRRRRRARRELGRLVRREPLDLGAERDDQVVVLVRRALRPAT